MEGIITRKTYNIADNLRGSLFESYDHLAAAKEEDYSTDQIFIDHTIQLKEITDLLNEYVLYLKTKKPATPFYDLLSPQPIIPSTSYLLTSSTFYLLPFNLLPSYLNILTPPLKPSHMQAYVKSYHEHGITTIEFFHPQSNSLPAKILDDLCKEIYFAGMQDDTKVIVLKSGGDGAFCAGASFDELSTIASEAQGFTFFSGFAGVINAIRKCKKLIIGRIHGKCVGGGVGIAAAVDYAIAVEKAAIKLSELSIGFGPFVIGPAIERKIGNSAFSQLAIDASLWRKAEWAKRKGLYAEVHTSTENLDEAVYRLANNLVRYNPAALEEMKKMFWKGTDHWDELLKERAAISGKLVLSDFTKTAIGLIKSNK